MESSFLTLRLNEDDVRTVESLRAATGLSKSALVKEALHRMAKAQGVAAAKPTSLYDLWLAMGPHDGGNVERQSSDAKRIVRERIRARHRR